MAMRALNIKIDEQLYEKIRALSFLQRKPMAVLVREYIEEKIDDQKEILKKQTSEIAEIDDEIFNKAMTESLRKFDTVYKKLAK